ncbi:hypothetical protein B0H10DRAFT_2052664 [Mycena sp. CBHHK59/15]|nr:hypothetical protein B0H10DRAFT_2052664 [Mycena sp. CBHHK59/15]
MRRPVFTRSPAPSMTVYFTSAHRHPVRSAPEGILHSRVWLARCKKKGKARWPGLESNKVSPHNQCLPKFIECGCEPFRVQASNQHKPLIQEQRWTTLNSDAGN